MRRLNGVDALLLYSEAPEIHMHTLKIGILDVSGLDGEFTFELFRRVAEPRLLALKPLRYQLVDIPLKLHHPMWIENADIDFDYHVRRVSVPAPGGRRELDQLIGEIASTPLDRSRPLWEMYVAEGLAGDRVAIIHKVHHVLADGVASANQMALGHPARSARVSRHGDPHRGLRADDGRAAQGGGPRPRPPDPAVTQAGRRDRTGSVPRAPSRARSAAAPRTRAQLRAAADVHQPRGVADAPVRHRAAGARRRQGDRPRRSASPSTTSSWRRWRVRSANCCCATTAPRTRR